MAISGQGWEIFIERDYVQTRNGRYRTIGTYKVFHDGVSQASLRGTTVETKGPGDNRVRGNGRRLEAGTYPLATQAGIRYVTIGYHVSADPDETPPGSNSMRRETDRKS